MNNSIYIKNEQGSFRDIDGYVFEENGEIYRHINISYKGNYDHLMNSGLFDELVKKDLIVDHEEIKLNINDNIYKKIKPFPIPFISYPYEWSFGQLKDAALLTIKIQKIAFKYGMTLKDCSAFNIQWKGCKPIFIDTLSFEMYKEGCPWIPYKQFCQHFLAPLTLISYKDMRLNLLSEIFIDGIPLDLTVCLLPKKAFFRKGLFLHLYLHAKSQKFFESKVVKVKNNRSFSKNSQLGLIDSLENAVKKSNWKQLKTEWSNYYSDTNYNELSFKHKLEIIDNILSSEKFKYIWDFGANIGEFSCLASKKNIYCVAFDIDSVAVQKNYEKSKSEMEENLLPLILDLTNPSADIGWNNAERKSLNNRRKPELIMALALIHHLVISNNLPFYMIANYFSNLAKYLIIEFIPKNDTQVEKLLMTRDDIFSNYNIVFFESIFSQYYIIKRKEEIKNTHRTLFYMVRRKR